MVELVPPIPPFRIIDNAREYCLHASGHAAPVPQPRDGAECPVGYGRRASPGRATRIQRNAWLLLAAILLSACGGSGGGGSGGGDGGSGDELPTLESITVEPGSALIGKNDTVSVQVTAHLSDGRSTTSLSGVNWSSDDRSTAEITDSSGSAAEITGRGLGDATITANFAGEVATVEVGVTAALQSLQVEPSVLELPEFDTEQLVLRALYADGSSRDVTTLASWKSSRPAVVTVDPSGDGAGTVEAVSADPDPVVVVAAYRGFEASAEIAVAAAPPDSVSIAPASPTVRFGETIQLTATAIYPGGVDRDQTDDAAWTSGNEGIVTADGGLLVPVSEGGPVTVTADVAGVTGTADVTVDPAVLDSLAVSPPTLDLADGSVFEDGFTLTATYSSGKETVSANEVAWKSSDDSVAFVSDAEGSAGDITAVAPGSATITVTLGSVSTTVTVTVSPAPDKPGELNLSALPDVILADGSDAATILARVSPNDLEDGISQGGQTVVYSIPDAGDPGTLSATEATTDANGEASVSFTSGTVGTTTVLAELEVDLSHSVQVRSVASFAEVFDSNLQTTGLDIVGGVIQADSTFTLTLFNGSNRVFDIEKLSITNGGISFHEEADPLGGTTGDLRLLPPYEYTFTSDRTDDGISVSVDLREPVTGSAFSISRVVTEP